MSRRIGIDQLAATIAKELEEYSTLTTDVVKKHVKEVGQETKKEIQAASPVKSGRYKKSWSVKTMSESSQSLGLVVHSRNRYQLTHLLEHGHAKRGGGRVRAIPHIGPAEEHAAQELVSRIEREL